MPLASTVQVSKASKNRKAGCGKKDGKPLPVNKNKTPTTLPVLPRNLNKFPIGPREKEVNDLFLTSIHLITLIKQKSIILTRIPSS